MNSRWWVAVMCCFISGNLWSQRNLPSQKGNHLIKGIVTDSLSGRPLSLATVTLFQPKTEKIVRGTTTNDGGQFTLNNIVPGNYKLTIASMGYKSYVRSSLEVGNEDKTLEQVALGKEQQTLESVTVTAQTKLIDYKIDKLVYNAEKDLTGQTGVATDILRKVPQVSVDVDGNVELSGSSSIRFLINGKSSTAFGSNIAEVLQSIPASQIKSIEVITSPGARYDAQGLGGIINIILKHNTARGINSNISLTAGTLLQNGSLNVTAREGNLGFNAFVSGNAKLPATGFRSAFRQSKDTTAKTVSMLNQDGRGRFRRHGVESGVGMDWTWKKKNNFSGSLGHSVYAGNGTGFSHQVQQVKGIDGSLLSNMELLNYSGNSYRSDNTDASLNYKRTFNKENQELELSYNTSGESSLGAAENEQFTPASDSLVYGVNSRNPGKNKETELKLDYTQPLNKHILLSMGGKSSYTTISSYSDVLRYKPAENQYSHDASLSNELKYHQKVYAIYAEVAMPVGNLFEVKAGSRYERTNLNTFYGNASGGAGSRGYNTLVPSIYFSKKLNNSEVLKISFTKRIERPGYDDLNPFINTSDPKNITTGNPNLLPEIGGRYEISYNRDIATLGSLMIAAFYRNSHHDIQPYITYYPSLKVGDSVYYNVSVSTRKNIGTEKNAGLNMYSDLHLTSKLSWRTNIFIFHRHIINDLDKGADRSSMNYRLNVNATYVFSHVLMGEFFGNFNSARNEVQGKYPSFTSYSLALRKQVSNKKGSIALTATNPFNAYVRQQTELFGPGFTQTSLRRIPFRSFGINFTWKFGRLEFKKEGKDLQEENTTVPAG